MDQFARGNRFTSIAPAQPGQGVSRRYVASGLPFTAEVLSYSIPGTGTVAGLVFAGVDPASVSRMQTASAELPAAAQSGGQDAVAAGAEQALRLCITPGVQPEARASMFLSAGFQQAGLEAYDNGDTTHYFTAAGGAVTVQLYYGNMPEECVVATSRLGVTEASQVLDRVVPQIYPGFVRLAEQGPVDPSTGRPALCARYEDPTNPIGMVIGVAPDGAANSCIGNGTSRFYQSYRV